MPVPRTITNLNTVAWPAVFFLFFAVTALVSFTLRQTQIRMLHFTGPCVIFFRSLPPDSSVLDLRPAKLTWVFVARVGQLRQYIRSGLPFGRLVVLHVLVRSIRKQPKPSGSETPTAVLWNPRLQESIGFVPVVVGVLFFLFEFLNDQLLAFMVLSLVPLRSFNMLIRNAA